MIQLNEFAVNTAGPSAVILPFRPAPAQSAMGLKYVPTSVTCPDIVDLAKEPGLPDRLRDLLER